MFVFLGLPEVMVLKSDVKLVKFCGFHNLHSKYEVFSWLSRMNHLSYTR